MAILSAKPVLNVTALSDIAMPTEEQLRPSPPLRLTRAKPSCNAGWCEKGPSVWISIFSKVPTAPTYALMALMLL